MKRKQQKPPWRIKLPSGAILKFDSSKFTEEQAKAHVEWLTQKLTGDSQ
jgi:hypothetical protein